MIARMGLSSLSGAIPAVARQAECRGSSRQQRQQKAGIDIAETEMAEPAEQRERHGMGDVGTDQPLGRQHRIKRRQHGDADGAGADRGQRDEQPQHHAEQDGRERARRHVA